MRNLRLNPGLLFLNVNPFVLVYQLVNEKDFVATVLLRQMSNGVLNAKCSTIAQGNAKNMIGTIIS